MLKELIHDKINEIFAEYQEANGICDGDISPIDALKLDKIESCLEHLITQMYAEQLNKPSFYIYTDCEGEEHIVHCKKNINVFFAEVSRKIAFDDCTDERVHHICWRGKPIQYAGWKPGMKYEYHDLYGNTVWVGYFPEWDH